MGFLSRFFAAIASFFSRLFGGGETVNPIPPVIIPPVTTPVDPGTPTTGGNKFALVVGINKYLLDDSNLNGCVADAEDIYNLLVEKGFARDDIRVLTDERATKQAILERLTWLVSDSKAGDVLVYYHSGHGTQVRDRDGEELEDQMDEVLVTHDHNWDDPLTDDMVGEILDKLPAGVTMIVIVDACHSGSITREIGRKARFIRAPFDISARSVGRKLAVRSLKSRGPMNHMLLSGCKDDQTSEETVLGDQVRGAMTFNLTQVIRAHADWDWKTGYVQLMKQIKSGGFSQEPQLNGPDPIQSRKPF